MMPHDRTVRALVLAALEDIAAAEQSGSWLRAIPSIDTLTSEIRRLAAGGFRSPAEPARADRDLANRGRS